MRPLLVAVIAVGVLGGVKWFLDSYQPPGAGANRGAQLIEATGDYAVELTLTFDVGPDEFSLEDEADAPSLLVQQNGKELMKRTEIVSAADSPLVIESVEGVVEGANEFYVQASPSEIDSLQPRSVRVRVLRDGSSVATETLWPDLGDVVQ